MKLPVFVNKKKETLVYYPVPKNANTTAKALFASTIGIDDKFAYRENIPKHKRPSETYLKKLGAKPSITSFFMNYEKFVKLNVKIKICIIRDPLERFISAYENRILFHKDRSFFEFTIDQVLDELVSGNYENKHFLNQSYFLGNDLSYFTHVYKMHEINLFYDNLLNFFGVKKKINIPHLQTGRSTKITLNETQKTKIKNIYQKDYILLDKYL